MAGYAVLDIETTGLSPDREHRVIEIAIVQLDAHGRFEKAWESLVNPMRDLGPQQVHRIRPAEAARAPLFEELAPDLIDQLRDRVIVAHSASFVAGFLTAEFARAGIATPFTIGGALCTLRLAELVLPGTGRSLTDCCAAYDIDLVDAHEALADAVATAQLLAGYLHSAPASPLWQQWSAYAAAQRWPVLPTGEQRVERVVRNRTQRAERSFLERASAQLQLPHAVLVDTRSQQDYLALIDRALTDGFCAPEDADGLGAAAAALGFSLAERYELHRRYFDALVQVVWADGMLTFDEADQIRSAARLLGIRGDHVASALEPLLVTGALAVVAPLAPAPALSGVPAGDPHLEPGAFVVLTGEMTKPRAFYEAALMARGLTPHEAVTRQVALVIAADTDSPSGKARKARDYGIPIVGEDWLVRELSLAS